MIEKVIIGEKEKNGKVNPRVITFILKSGNEIKCEDNKNQQSSYEVSENYLQKMNEPCGVCGSATIKIGQIILDFDMLSEIVTFEQKGKYGKEKHQNLGVRVKVISDMVSGNT